MAKNGNVEFCARRYEMRSELEVILKGPRVLARILLLVVESFPVRTFEWETGASICADPCQFFLSRIFEKPGTSFNLKIFITFGHFSH